MHFMLTQVIHTIQLILPLVYSTLASAVTPDKLGSLWFVLVAGIAVISLSYIIATLLGKLPCFRVENKTDFDALRIAAAFPNSEYMRWMYTVLKLSFILTFTIEHNEQLSLFLFLSSPPYVNILSCTIHSMREISMTLLKERSSRAVLINQMQ